MSYSETDGKIVLTMEQEDYEQLLQVFAIATVAGMTPTHPINTPVVKLLDRLHEGNPNYRPYFVDRTVIEASNLAGPGDKSLK